MSEQLVWIAVIFFWATFTQGVAGFGLALVAMPPLGTLVGFSVAAPLVAAVGLFSPALIAWRYRQQIEVAEITYAALGSLIGIPLGVTALDLADEQLVTALLGVVIIGYVAYSLKQPDLVFRSLKHWGTGLGVAAGVLTGAYNTGGPALVIFGTGRKWSPASFKANLQVLLLLHSVVVVATHRFNDHYTDEVLRVLPTALVFAVIGTLAGLMLDRFINPVMFRRLIFLVLFVSGVYLIGTAVSVIL